MSGVMTWGREFVIAAWATTAAMAPFLMIGFAIAGILSVWLSPAWIERHLGGRGLRPVLMAALCGIPLPLCSCGILPVAAALRRGKAGKGAVAAFMIATPQTGVDSLVVTGRLLGPVFAVFRVLAALFSGVLGGMLITWFADRPTTAADEPVAPAGNHGGHCCGAQAATEEPASGNTVSRWRQAWHYGFVTLVDDLAWPLLAGIALAAVITLAMPPDAAGRWFGTGLRGMLMMMALGMPMYICATGSVPVAVALLAKGVTPGAALVFLMTGPATNAASLAALGKLLGVRATAWYLAAVALSALLAGLALDACGQVARQIAAAADCHPAGLSWGEHLAATVLMALLAAAIWRRIRADRTAARQAQ